ncbi:MAG: YdcF family protein [Proteobacteria bacterium]|nr:YdcF family protein [Pseudomonadota bacterium]
MHDRLDPLRRRLGFLPGAIAVMGKWEPHMGAEQCLREVSARAAAAVGLAEALELAGQPRPYLLSAEGHLLRQPRPGCQLAAQIMIELGANAEQIRCWPAANRTLVELQTLDRMRRQLGVGGLLMITGNYHVPRTGYILRRFVRPLQPARVLACTDSLIQAVLGLLPSARQVQLDDVIQRGTRRGPRLVAVAVTEGLALIAGAIPGLEAWLADTLRGLARPEQSEMQEPEVQER